MIGAARIAGIMAAKRTSDLIPLCHPLNLAKVSVDIAPDEALPGLAVRAEARCVGPTGVEMEALTAVSVACLTIYDMAKAIDRGMSIEGLRLIEKRGGKSGEWRVLKSRRTSAHEPKPDDHSRGGARRVLASAETPLGEENVALEMAYGRVLASNVKALRTQPPFPNSAMDGYALRAIDTASPPATLNVIGKSAAGRAFAGALGPGEAVRIFTGAPMPDGADAIVIQEDVEREGERIAFRRPRRSAIISARPAWTSAPASPCSGWPAAHSPRRRACRGGQSQCARRPPARPGRDPGDRRRTGRARRRAGPGADHRLEQFRRRRNRRSVRRRRDRPRHRG